MDTTRWKSILVPREVYDEIRAISAIEPIHWWATSHNF